MADRPPPTALQDNASFARKFIGGTTNLAQRRRYREDIQAARNEEYDMEEQQFERANRAAELADPLKARAIRATEQRLEYGADQFETKEGRLGRQLELQRDAYDLRAGKQSWMEEQAGVKLASEKMKQEHETSIFKGMADAARKGLRPGTQAFATYVGNLVDSNYAADDKILGDLLKTARLDGDVADFLAKKARLKEQGIDSRFTVKVGPDGRESFTLSEVITPAVKPEKSVDPAAERVKLQRKHAFLQGEFNKIDGKKEPDLKKSFEEELHDIRGRLLSEGVDVDSPAQPATAAASPVIPQASVGASDKSEKPVIRFVKKDGKYVQE